MRPIAELSVETVRDVVGLVFDVDDTVTTHGRLQADAFEALWRLHRAGLKLVAVTGRSLGWTEVMASMWPIDLAVGENGAGWHVHRSGALAHGFFHPPRERARQRAVLERVQTAVRETLPHVRLATDQGGRRCDLAYDVGEGERVDAETVAGLVEAIETQGARALVSSVHAHAIPGEWDKARGVARAVAEELGIELDPRRWIFVGDSGNDAAAFSYFVHTVGVANVREALPRLPCPPRYVTDGARGAGFVELALHLIAPRVHGG